MKKEKDVSKIARSKNSKKSWSSFKENSMDSIIKVGSKIGNNRFLVAIRDSFMLPFALTTGAAIPLILANLFFTNSSTITIIPGIKDTVGMLWVEKLIGNPLSNAFYGAMSGFSIYLCLGMGYFLAKSYGKDGMISAALCVAVYFILKPLQEVNWVESNNPENSGTMPTNYLGNNGMIVALISSMLTAYIYCKLMDVRWLVPKLPEQVPPMVAKAFGAIFIASIVLTGAAFISNSWYVLATELNITGVVPETTNVDGEIVTIEKEKQLATIFMALEYVIAGPMMGLGTNIGTTILISFLIAFFWFFGIHGTNIVAPVTALTWGANVLRNTEYWIEWKDLNAQNPQLYNDYWSDVINVSGVDQKGLMELPMEGWGYIGGTGATFGFILGLLIFSKSKVHREISKLSIAPAIFGINEPVNFGIPIVLTPIYFLPYVIGFTFIFTMGHVWIILHWVRPGVIWTPQLPYGINVLFATDFDWRSIIFSIIQFGFSFLVWLPFVFIGPKYQEKVEEIRLAKIAEKKAEKLTEKNKKTNDNKSLDDKKNNDKELENKELENKELEDKELENKELENKELEDKESEVIKDESEKETS